MAGDYDEKVLEKIERLGGKQAEKLINYKELTGVEKVRDENGKIDIKRDKEDLAAVALEQWKVCVQIAQNTSQRRATANTVYTALNTGIIGYMFTKDGGAVTKSIVLPIIGTIHKNAEVVVKPTLWPIIGSVICIAWIKSIKYYRDLNTVKYNIIKELEEYIGIKPFQCESYISPQSSSSQNELAIPWLFIAGYTLYAIWIAILTVGEKYGKTIYQWFNASLEGKAVISMMIVIGTIVTILYLLDE